ncbi:MAG: hypothetical protein WB245_11290, partial [Acidimicrobiia bacterium]
METDLGKWIATGVTVGLSVLLYLTSTGIGSRFVRRVGERNPDAAARAATLWIMVRRVIAVIILVFAILMVFSLWGFSLAPFLALGTVLAAAVGFGAQDVVKDLLAGFFILAEDQYQ